jgi:hypothetical protein
MSPPLDHHAPANPTRATATTASTSATFTSSYSNQGRRRPGGADDSSPRTLDGVTTTADEQRQHIVEAIASLEWIRGVEDELRPAA